MTLSATLPQKRRSHTPVMVLLAGAAVILALLSLHVGLKPISAQTVWSALSQFDPNNSDHLVVRELRLPRALAALLGGGALGMAGALMQSLSRNPLADPGLLGVNGGAALGVVIAIWGAGIASQSQLIAPSLAGAAVAALLVFALGGSGRPSRLVLAGAAVGALFMALTWAILLLSRESMDIYRFWVLGGFTGITLADLMQLLPLYVVALPLGLLAAILQAPLVLGDDTARALGVKVGIVRALSLVAIVLLCGTTVSMAGPIAFVGLLVPHLVRPLVGSDIRRVALAAFFAGGVLAIGADTLGRLLLAGQEIKAGEMMALIGGPTLIYLVRRTRRAL